MFTVEIKSNNGSYYKKGSLYSLRNLNTPLIEIVDIERVLSEEDFIIIIGEEDEGRIQSVNVLSYYKNKKPVGFEELPF